MIELLEHNKETYKRLCDVLEDKNKCALVQATGTGKSYIAGKYIEEHTSTVLILVPTNAIADAWEDLLVGTEKEIDVITYQSFVKEPQNYFDYDLVIADEMHHLGSDVWGKKFVETYLQSENHKIIGLTATEIRYLDNSRDMAEEIFENIRVDGCDLPTAINTGVLPTFKYVSALYCNESDFDEWKEKAGKIKDIKAQTELKGRLDVCIKNMVSVKQAVNENLTDDYKKIIVFLNNVESKETALEMFKDVFPTANFYDVDYSKQRSANNEQINSFKADSNRAVLFAVDMLNEGIHIKGTDCVIMFRKTVSPQVYLQQLGRGLASGADKMPVIFDFVSNIKSIGYRVDVGEGRNIIEGWNENISAERKILYKSYVSEMRGIIDNIIDNLGANWTKQEDDFIRENYENMKVREIAKNLKRPASSVSQRCLKLGFAKKKTGSKHKKVKIEDIKNISNIQNKTIKEIAEELNLTEFGVRNFLKKNRIEYKIVEKQVKTPLTEEEKRYILKNQKEKSYAIIARELGRGEGTIYNFLRKNGIRQNPKRPTEKERMIIKNFIEQGKGYTEIGKIIGREKGCISRVAKELGIQSIECMKNQPKSVVQFDMNMNYIATFKSSSEAAKITKCTKDGRSIRACAVGKAKSCGGYKWLYEEDYKKMIAEQKAGEA